MKKVKDATLAAVLGHHVVMVIIIEGHTHIKDDVGVPHLVDYLNLSDEVEDVLFRVALTAEALNSYWSAHPLSFEDLSISTTSNEVILDIKFEVWKFNVEGEAMILKSFDEVLVRIGVQRLVVT